MIELVIGREDVERVRAELTGAKVEACAILYTTLTTRADGTTRLLVQNVEIAGNDDYARRGALEAELTPLCVARVAKRALRAGLGLVFVHSHPGSGRPDFSPVDSVGEEHLAAFLERRHPATHAALVVSTGGLRARRLGTLEEIRVIAIGEHREVLFDPDAIGGPAPEVFDRQVRAFGVAGQRALQRLRVAVVGLGGTGSVVTQQLVHLGVRDFVLIDPDVVEATNLNRVADASVADLASPKVNVAARYVQRITPDAQVACIQGDIIRANFAREMLNADLIFGCTDSHGSRAILQQVAYQYLIPCIDMGTTIAIVSDRITHVYGRVQLLAPGLACFTCSGLLDANEVRRDMMTAFERKADPYLSGAREPAPAVMSLNGTVASLAVTMFLSVVAGIPSKGRYLLYNAMAPSLRTIMPAPDARCYICSRAGSFARGDAWPLMGRQD